MGEEFQEVASGVPRTKDQESRHRGICLVSFSRDFLKAPHPHSPPPPRSQTSPRENLINTARATARTFKTFRNFFSEN